MEVFTANFYIFTDIIETRLYNVSLNFRTNWENIILSSASLCLQNSIIFYFLQKLQILPPTTGKRYYCLLFPCRVNIMLDFVVSLNISFSREKRTMK